MAYDIFGRREMTRTINQMKPPGNFFRSRFFAGPPELHDTAAIDIDIYKGQRKVAPYTRATNKSTPLARTPFQTGSFKIPYIKLNRTLAAAEVILNRSAGDTIYSEKTPAQLAAEQVAKDLFDIEEAIARAEELQAAQAIIDAKVIIKGFDVDAEIDLGRDPALSFVAPVLWGAAGVDIHEQLRTWAALVYAKSGYVPNVMLGSPTALSAFFKDAGVRSILDNRRMEAGAIVTDQEYAAARSYGSFAGFQIWEYYDLYLDDADNTEKPFIPNDYIVLASSRMQTTPHYGVIQDFGSLIPTKRFAKTIVEEDPSAKVLIVQSAPAFINHTPDATAKIKVL
jgi:hypothetical protein